VRLDLRWWKRGAKASRTLRARVPRLVRSARGRGPRGRNRQCPPLPYVEKGFDWRGKSAVRRLLGPGPPMKTPVLLYAAGFCATQGPNRPGSTPWPDTRRASRQTCGPPAMSTTWQCGVCETINHSNRECTACGPTSRVAPRSQPTATGPATAATKRTAARSVRRP